MARNRQTYFSVLGARDKCRKASIWQAVLVSSIACKTRLD
jgi:hypothetical protein